MLVKVNVPLVNMDGTSMKDRNEQGEEIDATFRLAMVNAVLSPVQKELGVDKVKKYELAKKIYTSDEVDLNEDDIKLIKDRVGENFAPIIVGQIYELLKV
ncbi:hypothetical protein LCGC14_1032520 [marine sediment metagenome]|uniref:Uncharacterized protein n=1 Tax=marine sediment metagenome TaxID=412755 RepID=A0A0F9NFY0_9ZZZZ